MTAAAVRAQVARDVRESRKLRVRLALASQRLEDFGPALVDLGNRFWALGAGGKETEIAALSKVVDVSTTLAGILRFELPGPGKNGGPALLIDIDVAHRRVEQLVVNTPGAGELWALSTSSVDVALRSRLYDRLPPAVARAVLAQAFPNGSAREQIEVELRSLEAAGSRAQVEETQVVDRLAEELFRMAGTVAGAVA